MSEDCGCTVVLAGANCVDRAELVRRAFRLEWLTIGWMIVEAVVALTSGIAAGSLSVTAFGVDSVIELLSATVLIWRLSVEIRRGRVFAEEAEARASRIAGALLFGLAAYVAVSAVRGLWQHQEAEMSLPGLAVTGLAIPIMYWLSRRKLAVAEALESKAMRADAMESLTCGYLSVVVVIGLVAQWLAGAWWIDAVTSLAIVGVLVREGREAWAGKSCGCCEPAAVG